MSFDVVRDELMRIYRSEAGKSYSHRARLTNEDIQRWTALIGEPRSVLYDRIAVYLARGFHNSELDFEICDTIINEIHGIITAMDDSRPGLFGEVYLAFDGGEFYHEDKRDEDPVEIYTRPRIAVILEKLSPR
jgi:hypothetical protein